MATRELDDKRVVTHAIRFDAPDKAVSAVKTLKDNGFSVVDVYSPFPLHGIDDLLDLPPTRLPYATLVGGLLGGGLGFLLQVWTHAVSWPLNVGGKGNVAWPGTVPVSFEVTVLIAAFCTVGGLLVANRLFPRPGAKPSQPHPSVTDDGFVVLVSEHDGAFSIRSFRAVVEGLSAVEVTENWRVS